MVEFRYTSGTVKKKFKKTKKKVKKEVKEEVKNFRTQYKEFK